MSTDDTPTRRMTRCPEGHVFDAAAHDACPQCGAPAEPAAAPEERAAPAPQAASSRAGTSAPSWMQPALIGGGGLLLLVLVAAVFFRGVPDDQQAEFRAGAIKDVADEERTDSSSDAATTSTANRDTERRTPPPAPGMAGFWEIFVPGPQGRALRWTMDFRSDGTYQFTDTSNGARHSGSYETNGDKWSLSGTWTSNPVLAPGTPFTDSGSYRITDTGTLVLQGQFGTGNWNLVPTTR